jgi:hypothetical protein
MRMKRVGIWKSVLVGSVNCVFCTVYAEIREILERHEVPFQDEDLWGAHSSATDGSIQFYMNTRTEFCCGISTRVLNFLWTLDLFKTFGNESVEAQPVVPKASSAAPFNRRPVSRCIGSRSRMHSRRWLLCPESDVQFTDL